jgi:hypothetical protein
MSRHRTARPNEVTDGASGGARSERADLDGVDQICRLVVVARHLGCRLTFQVPEELFAVLQFGDFVEVPGDRGDDLRLEVIGAHDEPPRIDASQGRSGSGSRRAAALA